ncbi:MAG: TRAP transporter substrate-binding protein [Erythrobacter sp.]|uniref:TRAP transporter substrate-binding protein n=1 Tax=Erythrobacter sp. TaxID=1042 RepID=UPI0026163BE4|nr:TRAP transporter substrate-binding protein [Erythrobacter sp.]MDJ0978190.1 TRAP transporter substrate-binding protein [Erythrobacter sp.]
MGIHGHTLTRRRWIAGAAAAIGTPMLAACERTLGGLFTAADAHPADYPTVRAVEYVGRLLAERSGGRLGVKVYSGGQLGGEIDTLEITSFGGLDFTRVNLAPLNSIAPLTIPASLPFVFRSTEHMRRALDGEIGEEILASLAPHGLIGLCFYDSGARSFYNTTRPIRTPEDMRGLKLRVPASDLYVSMVNALGANAVPIPYGEVYQALAQGVIDGAENNWPSFESARHYEVAGYYSLSRHLLTPEVLVMSKHSWDRLSEGERTLIRTAARDSVSYMRKLWDERVAQSRAQIVASGVEVNELDTAGFAARMKSVWQAHVTTAAQARLVEQIVALEEPQP